MQQLVQFAGNYNNIGAPLQYTAEIGNYLHQVGEASTDPIIQSTYLGAAKQIGDHIYTVIKESEIHTIEENYLDIAARLGSHEAKNSCLRNMLPNELEAQIHEKVQSLSKLRERMVTLFSENNID